MKITKLQKSDLKDALELVWTVFQEFEAPDYSEQGIETFKAFIVYDSIVEKYDHGELIFWGCSVLENLVGVIAVRGTGHICLLFVKKAYHRQGIAKKLFEFVVEHYKIDPRISNITVNSSPYAVEAYHHLGFKDTNTEQMLNGIRFTPMAYWIDRS